MSELNPQKKKFCQEYLIDFSGKKAAIRAGYSIDTAVQQASRFLKQTEVKEEIARLQKEHADSIGITKERVLQELAKIAFSNVKHYLQQDENGDTYVDLQTISNKDAAALTELIVETNSGKVTTRKVRVKLADKIAALINIGKHLGMFKEQVEHSGKLTLEQLVEASMTKDDDQKE